MSSLQEAAQKFDLKLAFVFLVGSSISYFVANIWSTLIQDTIEQYTDEGSYLWTKFLYTIIVTVVAVLVLFAMYKL